MGNVLSKPLVEEAESVWDILERIVESQRIAGSQNSTRPTLKPEPKPEFRYDPTPMYAPGSIVRFKLEADGLSAGASRRV